MRVTWRPSSASCIVRRSPKISQAPGAPGGSGSPVIFARVETPGESSKPEAASQSQAEPPPTANRPPPGGRLAVTLFASISPMLRSLDEARGAHGWDRARPPAAAYPDTGADRYSRCWDGRDPGVQPPPQYTVDPDPRAGHRSATNSRPAGPYVGFELHLAVQTRDVRWTDGIERNSLGPEVAGVITTFSLVVAGTHRGRAIVDELLDGDPIEDVVWDPGYSLCKPGTVHHRLAQADIHQTFQPVTHQRGIKPFSGEALLIDGQLFRPCCPRNCGTCGRRREERRRKRSSPTRPSSTSGHAGGSRDTLDRIPMGPPLGGDARSARGCCGAGRSQRPCATPGRRRSSTWTLSAAAEGS